MAEVIFNPWLPIKDFNRYSISSEDYVGAPYLKSVEINNAISLLNNKDYPKIAEIISYFVAGKSFSRNNVLVDVKVHDLHTGDIPALPGWHCDKEANPLDHSCPDIHSLYHSCDIALTEFIAQPFKVAREDIKWDKYNPWDVFKDLTSFSNDDDVFQLEPEYFYTYGRFHFHRATPAIYSGPRLLIKITESDIISPRAYQPNGKVYIS